MVQPFIDAYKWIATNFFGQSPSKIGLGIVKGLQNSASLIFDALSIPWKMFTEWIVKPFQSAWDWISSIFVGQSPSKLGMGIVQGIVSSAAMIFDALSAPWRMFMAWIVEKIPFVGKKWAGAIRGGYSGMVSDMGLGEKQETIGNTATIRPEDIPLPDKAVFAIQTPDERKQKEQDSVTLNEILKAINVLNSNLMSGKIGTYIDGQLMSATLSRQTAFKGGYGVNSAPTG